MMTMNCFCEMVNRRKTLKTPRVGFELALSLSWTKLCSSDNHYTTMPFHCFDQISLFCKSLSEPLLGVLNIEETESLE